MTTCKTCGMIGLICSYLSCTNGRKPHSHFLDTLDGVQPPKPTLSSLMTSSRDASSYDVFLQQLKSDGLDSVKTQFLNSIGAIMLIMDGYDYENKFANPERFGMARDEDSWQRITPTWKSISENRKGPLEFGYEASGTHAIQQMDVGFTGDTLSELANYLELQFGVAADHYNELQVRMMFQFNLKPATPWVPSSMSDNFSVGAVLVFSFGGTGKGCRQASPDSCPDTGASNEMLGGTTLAYLKDNTDAIALCQWEVGVAMMKARPGKAWEQFEHRVFLVGKPGIFQSTSEILEDMLTLLEKHQESSSRYYAILAHPDHLPRAYITVATAFAKPVFRKRLRDVEIIPAILPYDLGWPKLGSSKEQRFNMFSGSSNSAWFEGNGIVVDKSKGENHGLGYFQSGSQQWTFERRNFLLYELWARAKVFAQGDLTWPTNWNSLGLRKVMHPVIVVATMFHIFV